MKQIPYKIIKHLGKLAAQNNGFTKELNLISWNNRESVYDIRTCNEEHTEFGKGVTLTMREEKELLLILNKENIT
ncbi:MAG: hypothetical protein IJC04_01945 [Oscillospiraceae bacterium]|nr:hypothetical protein [Oscillospiraceae bacterium]